VSIIIAPSFMESSWGQYSTWPRVSFKPDSRAAELVVKVYLYIFLNALAGLVSFLDARIIQACFSAFPRPSKLQSICVAILTFAPNSFAKARTKPGFCWSYRPASTASIPECSTFSVMAPVLIPPTAVTTSLSPAAFFDLLRQMRLIRGSWLDSSGRLSMDAARADIHQVHTMVSQ
jgi:hypothetical protein